MYRSMQLVHHSGWRCPRDGMEMVRDKSYPFQELNPGHTAYNQSFYCMRHPGCLVSGAAWKLFCTVFQFLHYKNETHLLKWLGPCALTEHHTMEADWGSGSIPPCILTLALDGGEWSAVCPSCFTPRERDPGTHQTGGQMGPRASLDMAMKRKIPSPCWDSNPWSSSL
jgi:hypothetical protein